MDGRFIPDLRDCCSDINKIKKWINRNKFDSNVKYLISYSVIRACGTIERVMKSILFNRISQGINAEAMNYFNKYITDSSFNPSTGQINRILCDFNPSWANAFSAIVDGTQQKADLNSLVQLRNDFAHGSSVTTSIETVLKYYISGVWVLNELCKIIV